jgi:uncharacterized phage-like protein YoqJ
MLTICFTGHRPNKLFGYDWHTQGNQKLMRKLKEVILETLIKEWNDFTYTDSVHEVKFIFGGALGIDQMAFNVCFDIRDEYSGDYILEIAVPFEGQERKWFNKDDIARYKWQLNESDKITTVDKLDKYKIKGLSEGEYHAAKLQKRNEYMVDNSDIVIAVHDGSKGGTANCVKYAEKSGRRIIRINPKEINH